jgi:hypothetical protein
MTEIELALLELRFLKSGVPYHVHTGSRKFICTSPYCETLFQTECSHGPIKTQAEADTAYDHGEID